MNAFPGLSNLNERSETTILPKMLNWLLAGVLLATTISVGAGENEERWWATQALPNAVIRTARDFPGPRRAVDMMIQSVAGLAAGAVNEGGNNELVWVDNGNADLEDWFSRWRAMHPNIKQSGSYGPWELVDRFAKQGVIKGYILYRRDQSRGDLNSYRPGMDSSVNVATSLAGILHGIIVDEELEKEANGHGLKRLLDVRGKTEAWCFQTYRDQFNRAILCTQDPKKPHIRDLAISQKAFTVFGNDEPTPLALAWLEPLSPILGWNGGDEFVTTDLSTRYGHLQTATDWCMNLPVLMAGSENLQPVQAKTLSPAVIDWSDQRAAVSFVETDGDNVQWFQGNFFRGNPSYWSNPDRGRIPFGWSSCFAQLAQLCPQAVDYAAATRTANDSFIEWGGGYYYPDHFAMNRKNRWELLARQARRTWALMQKTGARIIGFNVEKHDSADTRKACEVFARETDGLLGILVFQYAPYEAGGGKRFWVKDRNGIDVPVITARYAIWENANNRARAGTPAKIAREIRQSVEKTAPTENPRYDWVICHAWSWFRKVPGADENAENLPQADAAARGAVRGYTPIIWCAERLPANIRVITPEELIWRIRMQHNPAQTKQFITQFN
jgi:hypothetical protein